jgi:hypothetical protein
MKRFKLIDQIEIDKAIQSDSVINTEKGHMLWGRMFQSYLKDIEEKEELQTMTKDQISKHLQQFIYQLKTKKQQDYKGSSLRTGFGFLLAFLKEHYKITIDLEEDQALKKVFSAKWKGLAREGKDEVAHATPLDLVQEKQLIDTFDTRTPDGLIRFIYYHISKYCAARGGHAYDFLVTELEE